MGITGPPRRALRIGFDCQRIRPPVVHQRLQIPILLEHLPNPRTPPPGSSAFTPLIIPAHLGIAATSALLPAAPRTRKSSSAMPPQSPSQPSPSPPPSTPCRLPPASPPPPAPFCLHHPRQPLLVQGIFPGSSSTALPYASILTPACAPNSAAVAGPRSTFLQHPRQKKYSPPHWSRPESTRIVEYSPNIGKFFSPIKPHQRHLQSPYPHASRVHTAQHVIPCSILWVVLDPPLYLRQLSTSGERHL